MDFLDFMSRSVSNFLAVDTITGLLREAGFTELREADHWDVAPGGKHYVVKNGTAVMAFIAGTEPAEGFGIIAAHSDSPGFRIKPRPAMACGNNPVSGTPLMKLNTEVYGGAIWHTWFDRPLGLSGRVVLRSDNPVYEPRHVNVRLDEPRLVIPHLAIHFNRQVNSNLSLSAQKDMLPVLGYVSNALGGCDVVRRLVAEKLGVTADEVLDMVRDMVFMSDEQRMRHTARPGLSGLAQVNGRNAISWEDKIVWDLKYIRKVQFRYDMGLVIATVRKVFGHGDGSESEEERKLYLDYGDVLLEHGKVTEEEYKSKQEIAKRILEACT